MNQYLPKNPGKIAILRALQIGDLLCTIPALRALRHTYPHTEIVLIGLPWAKALVERFHYLDRLIVFPGFPGLPEQPYDAKKIMQFIGEMQAERFNLVLQMQGDGSIVNPLVELFQAEYTAGFYNKESYQPNNLFMEYPDHGSEIHRMLKLMQFLGIELQGDYLEFPILEYERNEFTKRIAFIQSPYVIIHPGARAESRRWSSTYFAQVGDYCYHKGFQVVVTGIQTEKSICENVVQSMRSPAINLAGQTSLSDTAILIEQSALLISNDTGVMHIAAALQTPSITISQGSDPARWNPLDEQLHVVVEQKRHDTLKQVFSEIDKKIAVKPQTSQAKYHLNDFFQSSFSPFGLPVIHTLEE